MPDIREQLRRIETSAPPDLWKEIEMRATREPTRDRAERVSVVPAPRRAGAAPGGGGTPGRGGVRSDRGRRVGGVPVGGRPAAEPATGRDHPRGLGEVHQHAAWVLDRVPGRLAHDGCLRRGAPDPANACQWFSPDAFGPQGNVVPEGWGYPLEVAIRGPFDDALAAGHGPGVVDVLVEEQVLVHGHRAVRRLEYETLNDVLGENGLHYEYVIELDAETTLIVHTTPTPGCGGRVRGQQGRGGSRGGHAGVLGATPRRRG